MGRTTETGASGADTDAKAMTAADAEAAAAEQAKHDAEVLARQQAEEAQLKAEAKALGEGEGGAPEAVAALTFDTSETGVDGATLTAWARDPRAASMLLLFGSGGSSVMQAAPVTVKPSQFTVEGQRIVFNDTITLLGSAALGGGVGIDSVALADSIDGPVRSVCELSGRIVFAAGHEFKFGPGAFLFG
jgi:hypothetical protein